MGSYKWSCKSPNMGYRYSYPTYNPLRTTHEPPSIIRLIGLIMDRVDTGVYNRPL